MRQHYFSNLTGEESSHYPPSPRLQIPCTGQGKDPREANVTNQLPCGGGGRDTNSGAPGRLGPSAHPREWLWGTGKETQRTRAWPLRERPSGQATGSRTGWVPAAPGRPAGQPSEKLCALCPEPCCGGQVTSAPAAALHRLVRTQYP